MQCGCRVHGDRVALGAGLGRVDGWWREAGAEFGEDHAGDGGGESVRGALAGVGEGVHEVPVPLLGEGRMW